MNLRVAITAAVLTFPVTGVAHVGIQLVTLSPGGGVLNVPGGPVIPMTAIGSGLLVIDHDMRLIMRLSERIQVLNSGRTICEGTPDHVRTDPAVLTAYLGTDSHAVG